MTCPCPRSGVLCAYNEARGAIALPTRACDCGQEAIMDLAGVSVVDNHCHSLLREPVRDRDTFRLLFAEASTPTFAAFVPGMSYYQAALVALADELEVSADEDAVVQARAAQDHEAWIARLLRSANLHALLVDDGVPPPALSCTRVDLARLAGCAVGHIWRLETAAQELILAHDRFEDLLDAWREGLQNLRGRGVIALKSIAAYRTGLDVAPPHEAGARAGFAAPRRVAERNGRVRLGEKALL